MIMHVKTGFWEVEKRNDYADDKELVKSKYEDIFKNELIRECYDATHVGNGLYKYIGKKEQVKPQFDLFRKENQYV